MRRWIGRVLLAAGGLGAAGCFLSETSVTNPEPLPPASYVTPSAPESVLVNLAVAYSRRDLAAFTDLLAPEYMFRFAGVDTPAVGRSTLTQSEEIQATSELFSYRWLRRISIQLPFGTPLPAAGVRFPPGTMLIRVVSPDVQVSISDGTLWTVSNEQEFYFRPGSAVNGEDPHHWFLLEWDEIATEFKPAVVHGSFPDAVQGTSWGKLKMMFWLAA